MAKTKMLRLLAILTVTHLSNTRVGNILALGHKPQETTLHTQLSAMSLRFESNPHLQLLNFLFVNFCLVHQASALFRQIQWSIFSRRKAWTLHNARTDFAIRNLFYQKIRISFLNLKSKMRLNFGVVLLHSPSFDLVLQTTARRQ